MRELVEVFCEDCPIIEDCQRGYTCEVVRLVHRSCTEQGVSLKVTDPAVIRKVATLLRPNKKDD